ncbi:Na+/H+ antiporter NhaC family protein [Halorubellus sp. PRR65]|uniref:Na+/H+ antiporter NhaC family protein n=1 Tax=Halorubellus sp. PRR65 TaxID=3098148 RepID=UPI002B26124C|nr:Na+/H+ antiporter NhaC family protein [Halorubellus sp. PRR65]
MAVESIDAGAWSLVPPLLAISLAWYTRDALIGLFVGIATAGPVYGALSPEAVGVPPDLVGSALGDLVGGMYGLRLVPEIIATAPLFSSAWYVENVLIALFAIGGMIGLMIRAGALQGVVEALAERVDDDAGAEKAAFLAGIAIHIDDYFNCLVVGSMMRPLTDKFDVSRAKLAYYVDSAGSPAARLAFYSTWGVALVGFIGGGLEAAAQNGQLTGSLSSMVTTNADGQATAAVNEVWPLFLNALFTGFYSWIALFIAAGVAWQVVPNFGPMREEERRGREEGKVVADDDDPMISREMDQYEMSDAATPDWRNFAIPLGVMIAVALGSMFVTASPWLVADSMNEAFAVGGFALMLPGSGAWSFSPGAFRLGLAAVTALVVAFVLYRAKGDIPTNDDATTALTTGMKGIFLAALILTFASSIQNAVTVLGIGGFVSQWFNGVPAFLIPLALFLVTAFVSFSDGSSWSTYGIMFPIAVPVALTTDANLVLVLGAVFSGGIFGDHSSPISDTTVLASSTSGSDHMTHVRTQIPYAAVTAGGAAVLFVLFGLVLPEGFRIIPY